MTPIAVFLPCVAGMAIGLAIDCANVHPAALASLCTSADGLLASAVLHWRIMPLTHGLMLAGAVVGCAIAEARARRNRSLRGLGIRACAHSACLLAMTAGMAIGALFAPRLGALSAIFPLTAMTAVMVIGMAAGMLSVVPVYRLLERCA